MICFIRVDDRLIHGQVQTSWISLSGAKNILVIDDAVAKDDMAIQILKFATPSGMKLKVLNVEEGYAFWNKAQASPNKIMVLMKSIHTVYRLAQMGITFEEVMVGPSSYKEGSTEIIQSTYFTKQEMEDVEKLHQDCVSVFFQHTPEQKKVFYKDLKI